MSTNPKVLTIFGAGPGTGTALARRFGREGFRIALIARNADRLESLVAELTAEKIEAVAFPADLSDPVAGRDVVAAVRERFGRIDVVSYQPLNSSTGFMPATELDSEQLGQYVNLLLLTPVAIAHAVLPEMIERGDGGIFVTGGFTAADPQPFISGIGPAMAGIRNFMYSLHGEVAGSGVYAGVVTLAALIKNSDAYNRMTPEMLAEATGGTTGMQVIDPAELAETYWTLFTDRDRLEYRFPAPAVDCSPNPTE